MTEYLELGRGEADPSVAALDAPPLEVYHEVAMAQDAPTGRIGEVAVRPSEQGLDPAEQLAKAVRLRQVIVRAELEADHLVDLVVPRREHEDRHLAAGRADPTQDLEAIDARKADIEHDQIRRLARGDLQPLFAGARDPDVVALLLERVLDAARDRIFVLDDQDGRTHVRDATPRQ